MVIHLNKNASHLREALKTLSVARSGFEPEHTEPESVVLPLYYQAKTEMAFRGARYIIIASESLLLQSLAAQLL